MGNSGQRSEQSRTVRIDNQHSQHGATTAIVVKALLLTGLRFDINELGLAGGRRPLVFGPVIRRDDLLSSESAYNISAVVVDPVFTPGLGPPRNEKRFTCAKFGDCGCYTRAYARSA
jgi:hypothetical protein